LYVNGFVFLEQLHPAFASVGLGIALSFLYVPLVVKYCGGGI